MGGVSDLLCPYPVDKCAALVYILKCKLREEMTMNATAKDLRFHSKELLDTVNRGEEVVITYRGKPCAKLVPFSETPKEESADELFGLWKDREELQVVDAYVRKMRKRRY
jgi:prevent-host-death family protein